MSSDGFIPSIPFTALPHMCYIEVDDVDKVYENFTAGLHQHTGKIPRSGIPRISKVKHLVDDQRFLMTDLGGNTFYIGTPHTSLSEPAFFRTIESAECAAHFELLYDLMYSKEDSTAALKMLEKFFPADVCSIDVGDLDLAKILLVALVNTRRPPMENEKCDLVHPNGVKEKKLEVMDGYTIKYHANGKTMWSKGKMLDDTPDGYWEWFRPDGTIKRSGFFDRGEPVGEWVTYDSKGNKHKTTIRDKK